MIELGKYEEGMRMLFQLTEPVNDPLDITISCCYLAKAEHRMGNGEKAWSWFKAAEKAAQKVPELSEMVARVKQELSEPLS